MAAICKWLQSKLYQQGGKCQAHLIVGVFVHKLWALHPHGSINMVGVLFTALESGGMVAMAILEQSSAKYHHHHHCPYRRTLDKAVNILI